MIKTSYRFRSRAFGFAAWLGYLGFAGLIVVNSLPYFTVGSGMPFIVEKGAVGASAVWRGVLLAHVAGSIVCLAAATGQFFRGLQRRFPAAHRWLGRGYVASVLIVVCPTGAYLALFAKGGVAGQVGFLLLGAILFHTTLAGHRAIRRRDIRAHIAWMIRSFAMAASAITFRILHVGFAIVGVPYAVNYPASLWLSILANFLAAECVVRRMRATGRQFHEPETLPYHDEITVPLPDPFR